MASIKKNVKIISRNQINNCDINVDDLMRAEDIWGTPPPILKGTMKRKSPTSQKSLMKVPLPAHILSTLRDVALFVDIFFVNGLPFFLTKSGKINFLSVTSLKSRIASRILEALDRDRKKYEARSLNVTDIHGDNEFNIQPIIDATLPALFHAYAREEHVGFIENSVKHIKERVRCVCHAAPYKRYTRLMMISLIEGVLDMLIFFIVK